MSTDRELLEMAAKANGMEPGNYHDGWHSCSSGPYGAGVYKARWQPTATELNPRANFLFWNPLLRNDEAMRLAVKLRLTTSWDCYDDCDYATATPPHTHQGYDCILDQDGDPDAAMRRAIVRAAAEIGRNMP